MIEEKYLDKALEVITAYFKEQFQVEPARKFNKKENEFFFFLKRSRGDLFLLCIRIYKDVKIRRKESFMIVNNCMHILEELDGVNFTIRLSPYKRSVCDDEDHPFSPIYSDFKMAITPARG